MMGEEILVVTFIDDKNSEHILHTYLSVTPGGTVAFQNKYFNISVSVRLLSNPEPDAILCDDRRKVDLARFPAIVLLSSSDSSTISRCQKLWQSMQGAVCEDAVRILFLDGDNLDEKQTYEIVAWGLDSHIEVVNSLLCKEDGIDIPARLKRALECSPWSSISHVDGLRKTTGLETKRNDAKGGEVEASCDHVDLSKPTSLRRGLHESDMTRLVNDLVLADDSDSDG